MTPDEERRAKAAENKRAYRLRKKQENLARQAPKEELKTMFNEQARNIAPELEEQFRKAQGNPEIRPTHPLADEPALLADTILNSYAKDFCNTNALLTHILAHLIRIEITLQDRMK